VSAINGTASNDSLTCTGDNDTISGDAGTDTVLYINAPSGVSANLRTLSSSGFRSASFMTSVSSSDSANRSFCDNEHKLIREYEVASSVPGILDTASTKCD
jgi:hypothetical protein